MVDSRVLPVMIRTERANSRRLVSHSWLLAIAKEVQIVAGINWCVRKSIMLCEKDVASALNHRDRPAVLEERTNTATRHSVAKMLSSCEHQIIKSLVRTY